MHKDAVAFLQLMFVHFRITCLKGFTRSIQKCDRALGKICKGILQCEESTGQRSTILWPARFKMGWETFDTNFALWHYGGRNWFDSLWVQSPSSSRLVWQFWLRGWYNVVRLETVTITISTGTWKSVFIAMAATMFARALISVIFRAWLGIFGVEALLASLGPILSSTSVVSVISDTRCTWSRFSAVTCLCVSTCLFASCCQAFWWVTFFSLMAAVFWAFIAAACTATSFLRRWPDGSRSLRPGRHPLTGGERGRGGDFFFLGAWAFRGGVGDAGDSGGNDRGDDTACVTVLDFLAGPSRSVASVPCLSFAQCWPGPLFAGSAMSTGVPSAVALALMLLGACWDHWDRWEQVKGMMIRVRLGKNWSRVCDVALTVLFNFLVCICLFFKKVQLIMLLKLYPLVTLTLWNVFPANIVENLVDPRVV